MPFELLSGPDLGGGFLFQLTQELSDRGPLVTVHAQEGGLDASGPPRGSPLPLGFARSAEPCPLGGRGCYHRSFELSEAAGPTARLAYNRLRFVFGPMLEQLYHEAEVPALEGLGEVSRRLSERSDLPLGRWFVGGSASALLQGVAVAPLDVDLGTDAEGVGAISDALADALIEPLARTTWPGDRPMLAARAFVGTLVRGVRVEWGVPLSDDDPLARYTEWGRDPASVPTVELSLSGRPLRASRLEFFLVAAAVKGRTAAVAATLPVLRTAGVDRPLLEALVEAAPLSEDRRRALASSFDE